MIDAFPMVSRPCLCTRCDLNGWLCQRCCADDAGVLLCDVRDDAAALLCYARDDYWHCGGESGACDEHLHSIWTLS